MNRQPTLILILLLMVSGPLWAETEYVTDKLRLGVFPTRETSGQALAYLNSGDAVEVLERDGRLTFVRLADERTGWVRGAYLQEAEPALRRIAGIEQENERLTAELDVLRAQDSGQELARLQAAVAEAVTRAESAEAEQLRLQAEISGLQDDLQSLQGAVPLRWLGVGVAIALLLGIIAAWRWFDYRSRRRHGGFRIY